MRDDLLVGRAPLAWWAGGLLLGVVMIMAVAVVKPIGVSTEFVVADARVIEQVRPGYVEGHPVIGEEKSRQIGYGWWFDIGILGGAFLAAVLSGRWRVSVSPIWWRATYERRPVVRLVVSFVAGILILFGARLAGGCTSGLMASGWAQLALAAAPFTAALLVTGIITAFIVYRREPGIEQ